MSMHYAAGQFDHAFQPKKLKNWEYGTNPWPGKFACCAPLRCGKTKFIACDNGHLYPCVPRDCCTSPWGDYSTWIWEQSKPCDCIRRLRHPYLYKPKTLINVTKEVPKPNHYPFSAKLMDGDKCALFKKIAAEQRALSRSQACCRSKKEIGSNAPLIFRLCMDCGPKGSTGSCTKSGCGKGSGCA